MQAQFSQELLSSFYLWFENALVADSVKAYNTNQSNSFEYVDFKDVPSSHHGYQGRFRQLVTDQDVDIPNSGFFIDGNFVTGAENGIYIDYSDGRIIVPSASGSGLTITANNTVKEVNTYFSEEDPEQLIITNDFIDSAATDTTHLFSKEAKRDEKTYILPACFIRYVSTNGEPISFGGEDNSKTRIQVVVLAYTNYVLDGIMGAFSDLERTCIAEVPYGDFPYGRFNDIKAYPYSYSTLSDSYASKTWVENITTSKVTNSMTQDNMQKNLLVGFLDFDLSTFRYPRV